MNYSEIQNATIEQLTAELGDDCYTMETIDQARVVLARRIAVFMGVDLIDSETNETIRRASEDEAAESIRNGHEGHIVVDGRKCYVA